MTRRRRTRPALLASLAASAALVTGCSSGSGSGDPLDGGRTGAGAQTDASASASDRPFEVEEVDAFDEPWAMTFLPGSGDLLVTERDGVLHLRDQESDERVEVTGVPEVVDAGQGGLGDVVAGPSYAEDGTVYLSWVEAGTAGTSGAVVGRARLVTDGQPRLDGLEVIWRQDPKVDGDGHFSHRIAVDPEGRHLFVSSGDRQLGAPAQDTTNTLGSIVRLDLDGDPAPGNPLADQGGRSAEIWSWGHRNPLGLEFAPDGTLWSSEMGPQGGDELNLVEAGGNYGWPEASNGSDYGGGDIPDHEDGDGFVAPVAWWDPSISPGSLMLYDGELFPDWRGDAFLGALSGEALVRVDLDGRRAGSIQAWDLGERIRAVEQAPDGSVWLLEDAGAGRLLRLTPTDG
ncbi:Glucose/arabinose dehydrogenase, beta-propeller fold [Nocardioides scoriae]|uniref:Glucose/arabinose dehydrogenase, beta-propeller fold n=1 Tax=Nocardioides scoriae TaxID=642780 RepID=A0A1H1U8D0_9ACTN|nr:PQQ-dependent sugar dehydrogenase [Nocardioides scoriae]SDS68643.1 Glucose/arabinose dehydrogenase, beta-propeller fold [Nocardioides scoriae]